MAEETNKVPNEGIEDESFPIDESNKVDSLHIMEEETSSEEIPSEKQLLQEKLEKSQKEAEENYQQFLRARADLENYRRRSRKEMEDLGKYASLTVVEKLLPVVDNFERALEAADKTPETSSLYEGVEMVYRQLQSALQDAGLTLIEAKGEPFDPHQHNAVMQEENADVEPGTVIEDLQPGYRFHDRVIRPSMVKISK